MGARVLVVDDLIANVKLLEARLTAEYFEVLTALSGQEALDICGRERADIVLLDVMMPGLDGFEVCRRLKADPKTQHIPVIMVTALDQVSDRVQGLEAGADDFLTKPVDDIALITRVRNLVRLKVLNDEMRLRAATREQLGIADPAVQHLQAAVGGRVMLVDDQPRTSQRMADALGQAHETVIEPDPQRALLRIAEGGFDLLLVSLSLQDHDGLRLCSQVRALERTRSLPIIIMVEPGNEQRLLRGLDMGVNDYLIRPIDRNELVARARTQIRRKRYSDYLRNRLEESVEQAIADPLTSLHNRRYMEGHLKTLVDDALQTGKPLSVLVTDIDRFGEVNDDFGHEAGDAVLLEFTQRLRRTVRNIDLACRLSGEQFALIMPETDIIRAMQVAERIRKCMAQESFTAGRDKRAIEITTSVGVASLESPLDTGQTILKRAEQALTAAKREGRNRVVADAA